jgi:hypothetical protein
MIAHTVSEAQAEAQREVAEWEHSAVEEGEGWEFDAVPVEVVDPGPVVTLSGFQQAVANRETGRAERRADPDWWVTDALRARRARLRWPRLRRSLPRAFAPQRRARLPRGRRAHRTAHARSPGSGDSPGSADGSTDGAGAP